jgi:outer membrane lipoprotein carrier protein
MRYIFGFLLFTVFIMANELDFTTIQSSFIQTITNEEDKKITYEGEFYATSNAKALWVYKSPIKKEIYFSKNSVVIVEPELEQAIITDIDNTPNITEILQGATKINENTYQASFEDTIYTIQTKNRLIQSIMYKDKLENTIVISLQNPKINITLEEEIFRPKIPQEYDIIKQ